MSLPFLPYGRQSIDPSDLEAVQRVLEGAWLTTGPAVDSFERAFAQAVGAAQAVAVNSGTAALHAAYHALGLGPGDEVIVPAMTFAATANAAIYQGARPVFADVDPDTLLLDPACAERLITPRTKALVAVDYAGQPCDYAELEALARSHHLALVSDACHALGATYGDRRVGTLARLSTFSLHPVKPVTSGEGGVITTDDPALAASMRIFRNHGITTDFRQRETQGNWFYEIEDLGYNYRLTDLQCALGENQLRRLEAWTTRRQALAAGYDERLAGLPVRPLRRLPGRTHAFHLYVVRLPGHDRAQVFKAMRDQGIGVNVHYIPVHYHPYYRRELETRTGLCPRAEEAYEEILTLPLFPAMLDSDLDRVVECLGRALSA